MSDDDEVMVQDEDDDFESTPAANAAGDETGEESDAHSTPTKGKKVAAKAGAKEKAPPKKKATAPGETKKRKEAPGAEGSGNAAKKVKAITNDATAKDVLRTYMKQQNRPYTALVIYENLHHQIKKPTVIKLCDELVEDGDLQMKDFKKTRIYMAKQSDADAVTPAELDEMKAREDAVKESLAEQKAKNAKLDSQIRALNNEPDDAELATQLAQYKKQIDALNAKLARFKGDKNPVTKEGMNKAQLAFNNALKQWRIRKRACEDMIDQMCGEEGDPKRVREMFSIETDEDAGEKLADWKGFEKDVKK